MLSGPQGELAMMITKIWMDPHGRSCSWWAIPGAINQGESVYAIGAAKPERVQQVSMVGPDRITVPTVVAGNIAAVHRNTFRCCWCYPFKRQGFTVRSNRALL